MVVVVAAVGPIEEAYAARLMAGGTMLPRAAAAAVAVAPVLLEATAQLAGQVRHGAGRGAEGRPLELTAAPPAAARAGRDAEARTVARWGG